MIKIKCTYSNGNVITTNINGDIETAKKYYVGQMFNIGNIEDDFQQCIKVELAN